MIRPERYFRGRLAALLAGGALVAALFPMAGSVLAAVPAAPPAPDLAAASDTGISPTDNITKTLNGLVFAGTVEAGSTLVTLYVGGSTPIGTAVPNSSGAYSVTTSTAIPDNTANQITARATNADGQGSASPATTVTTDNTAPTVTGVTSPTANGTYAAGMAISVSVAFDDVVWVTGTPMLALATTSPASTAAGYTGGNGTNTLTFGYTVAAGNSSSDLDYVSTSALALNGGAIADTAGNAATLTLAAPGAAGSLGANKSLVVDTAGPTVTINQAAAQADPTKTSPVHFTVVFSASVTDFATGDVTLGGSAGATTATVTGSGTTYDVAVTGMSTTGTVIASLAPGVATSSGHPSAASTSTDNTVTWDVTAPTVTINQAVGQADPTGTTPMNFTVVFSEAVTGFVTGDVTLSSSTAGGSKSGTVTGSGTTYNVAVTGMTTAGNVVATVAAGVASDASGNLNVVSTSTDNSVSWDPFAGPTVTINQAAGQPDPTATSPINFTVTFSAPVTGFDATDVTLVSTAGTVYAVVTATSTSVYNVAVYGMSASGTVIASVAADRAVSVTGNHPNLASTSTDNTVTFRVASKFLVTSSTYSPVPGSPVTITAQLADSLSNAVPASGIVVTWTSTNGGSFSTATSTTNASGIATVTFTVSTTTGTIHTVTATGGGFTGTSTNIAVTANPATITLTTSAPTPPGAQNPVITWGQGFNLGVQFAANGSGRSVQLQGTRDGLSWTTITTLTMGTSGGASYHYTPVTNLWYRVVFAGTTDLGAATSNQVRTVVREIAVMRPTNGGAVRSISRNSSVTFATTVRPARPELAPAKVSFWFYHQVNGSWVLAAKRDVLIDAAGVARSTFKFTSSGQWYVRSAANPTPYNANSVTSPVERYSAG